MQQARHQPGIVASHFLLGAEGVERPHIEDFEGFLAGAVGAWVPCLHKTGGEIAQGLTNEALLRLCGWLDTFRADLSISF